MIGANSRPMRYLIFFLLCSLVSSRTIIYPEQAGEQIEKSFDFSPGGRINVIASPAGDIAVLGWDRPIVKVVASKRVDPSSVQQLKDISFRTRHTDLEALIQTIAPASIARGTRWRIDYTLYVPAARTDLRLLTGHGSISIKGVGGWLAVETLQGEITLQDLKGHVSAITGKGDITVRLQGPYWDGSQLAVSARCGNIILEMPTNYAAQISLSTKRGKIIVDYPPQDVSGEQAPLTPVHKKGGSLLTANLARGGAPISAHTERGDIYLRAKE